MNHDQVLEVHDVGDESLIILPFIIRSATEAIEFFLNIHKVVSVFDCEDLTPLPRSEQPFSHLFNFQDMAVPIMDLACWLDPERIPAAAAEHSPRRRILICQVMSYYIGIIVDQTRKVERVENEDIASPPPLLTEKYPFVNAILKQDRHYRYMLDVEYFVKEAGIDLAQPNESSPPPQDIDLSPYSILVVEDSKFFRTVAKNALSKKGAQIDMAVDGQEGLAKLEQGHTYDAVIADIEMPAMNGIDMIKQFRKRFPSTRTQVIFHSSLANEALARDIQNAELGIWLQKFEEHELIRTLARVLQQNSTSAKSA
jgi:CheY-like chemotaxis protein